MKPLGLIIAAGKQTRFSMELPKALVPIKDGKSLLELNILQLKNYCEKIYITCSKENINFFKKELSKIKLSNIFLIEIESGLGCGDAVLKTLRWLNKHYSQLNKSEKSSVIMIWGDSIQTNQDVFNSIKSMDFKGYDIGVPAQIENKPYVKFNETNLMIDEVLFSKYDTIASSGYHDFSIFHFKLKPVLKFLEKMRKKFTDKSDNSFTYLCRKNQLIFLDIFNFTDIKGKIFKIEKTNDINGFNTLNEYLILCGQYNSYSEK